MSVANVGCANKAPPRSQQHQQQTGTATQLELHRTRVAAEADHTPMYNCSSRSHRQSENASRPSECHEPRAVKARRDTKSMCQGPGIPKRHPQVLTLSVTSVRIEENPKKTRCNSATPMLTPTLHNGCFSDPRGEYILFAGWAQNKERNATALK